MTTKSWVEMPVEIEWEWDDDQIKILAISTREKGRETIDITAAVSAAEITALETLCKTDWIERMREEK